MHRFIVITSLLLFGLPNALGRETLRGEPVYDQFQEGRISFENVIVHGNLVELNITQPTYEYGSAFGDGYCMREEITYQVENYVLGNGPPLLKFSQHAFNRCSPISEETGLGESLLFLSFNNIRGIWAEIGIKLYHFDGRPIILYPEDINKFRRFKNFADLLTEHDEPVLLHIEKDWHAHDMLLELKKWAVLDFQSVRLPWPERPGRAMESTEYYETTVYRYIDLSTLLEAEF